MANSEQREQANQWCFGCGRQNPIGLKLEFTEENDLYSTKFTAGPEHQSYDGIVHGGIISTLLDEITARYLYSKGYNAVTARLEVRFRKPTPIGVELTATSKIISQRRNIYEVEGIIKLPNGTVTAEAKATVAVVNGGQA